MNRPKISVLIPVYNVEKYLAECLDSIVGQTLGDIEIICVNDGSTDSSPETLKKYAERDGRIRIIESENKGCCHARRLALREAMGEYVLMCDSDDKYTYKEAFKDIYATAEKYRTDLVLIDFRQISEKETFPVEYPAPDKEVFTARDYENPFITPAQPWTKLYKKAFLDKYDDWYFPDENVTSGDMPLHFQTIIRASSIHHLKKPVYTYRENRPKSLQSTALTETKIRQFCDHFKAMAKTVREEYDFEPHRHLIIRYFFNSLNWRLEKYYRRNIRLMDPETALKIKDAAGDAWATKGERDESEYLKSEEDRKSLVLVKACLRLPPGNLMKYLDMKYHKNLVAVKDESIALRDRIIREQNGFVTYRDGIIKEQDRIIKEKDEHIRNLDELAKSHESQMKRQDEHIRNLGRIIGDRDAKIRDQERIIGDRDAKIRDQERIIGDRDAKIRAMRSETDAILKSWSYRTGRVMTSPLSAPLEAFRSIRDSILVKKSGLFDAEWYLEQNKDVAEAKADPVRHYLKYGWREGRDPSGLFSTSLYLKQRPDAEKAGVCPLVHYETIGKKGNFKSITQKIDEISSLNEEIEALQKEVSGQEARLKDFIDMFFFVSTRGLNEDKISYEMERFKGTGTSDQGESKNIVVSLTSYPERMYDIHNTLFSLLNQTLKPGRIILWLGREEFPGGDDDLPKKVIELKKLGLSIEYTENERSYKKLIPALKKYGDKVIVTADDDIFYPEDWLERLYNGHKKHGDCVLGHRCHKMTVEDGRLLPYSEWPRSITDDSESFLNFLTGAGGILYPPGVLHKDALDKRLYTTLAPTADDIWFWAMTVLNGKKIRVIDNPINKLTYTNPRREKGLSGESTLLNQNVDQNRNDAQIANVLEHYPEIREKIGIGQDK